MRFRWPATVALVAIVLATWNYRQRGISVSGTQPAPSSPAEVHIQPVSNDDFRTLFLLLVSLLQGGLLFVLGDQAIDLAKAFNWEKLSLLILFFAIFFRVVQTHLLAALKYSNSWQVKPFDFMFVFFAALLEYLVFMHASVTDSKGWFLRTMLVTFALFGVAGYSLTYASVRRRLSSLDLRRERKIQTMNITVVVVMGTLCLWDVLWRPFDWFFIFVNYVIATALIVNIYVSLRLSSAQISFSTTQANTE